MAVNLNYYWAIVWVFNNRISAQCSSCNIECTQPLQNCDIFYLSLCNRQCVIYYLLWFCIWSFCCHIYYLCVSAYNITYFFNILMLIIFGFSKLSWNLAVTMKKITDLNLTIVQNSPFVTGMWTVFLHITALNYHF